jgi:uncharacterized lipoprotein YddW (UPF0748 family)
MRTLSFSVIFLCTLAFLSGCSTNPTADGRIAAQSPPAVAREFRAVWVATVVNIDWPSRPGLSTEAQQQEARRILDSAASIGLNAVVLQVRPHCDALYASSLEPWSWYLTGEEGKPPAPFYDPLTFWIEEAHHRGLELHAWFNPYRAHLARGGPVSDSCIVHRHPELVRFLPDSTYWLDPGDPRVQDYSFNVIMDVLRRYDVDGIHFDDYFYPYGDGSFPDDTTWHAYTAAGGTLSRNDWRRANVNTFIKRMYEAIKKEKVYVKFGLSPFGIWRPGSPPSIAGFDQYDGLFADARLWFNKGWMDYWSPQLYWPINQIPQSYPVLLGWWTRENTLRRHLWPGLFTSRLNSETGLDELVNEIMVERGAVPENPGHIHFSMRTFLQDSTILPAGLRRLPYRTPALVPATPWLGDTKPQPPRIDARIDSTMCHVTWTHDRSGEIFRWVCYVQYGNSWKHILFNRADRELAFPVERPAERANARQRDTTAAPLLMERLQRVELSAVDRLGNESDRAVWSRMP